MKRKTLKVENLAEILAKDLSLDSLKRYMAAESQSAENCRRYGRYSKLADFRVKAAELAIKAKGA